VVPEAAHTLLPTFVALCLGALVGLERQVSQEESGGQKDFPGARTFAFTALVGALAVLLSRELGQWIGIALFLASATFLVIRYQYDSAQRGDPGYTTETASLCTFAVGALAQSGQFTIASAITIVMVALLRSKRAFHQVGTLLSPADMAVGIRFLVITGIVLPLLPTDPIDPWFQVVRPRNVWWMAVLISSVSFVGYVLTRVNAGRQHHLATGVLGGLVSSTATAVASARAAHGRAHTRAQEAVIALAVATCFVRMGIELAVVNRTLFQHVVLPLAALCGFALLAGWLFHRPGTAAVEEHHYENPLSLRVALFFAATYAAVLLLVAASNDWLHDTGLLATSALAALVGADAPTLSLARLEADGLVETARAARGVLVVGAATTLSKVGILLSVGGGEIARRLAPTLLAIAGTGALLAVFAT
jgi:uncharacterized membrane protein (DUF4010 family)